MLFNKNHVTTALKKIGHLHYHKRIPVIFPNFPNLQYLSITDLIPII